MPGQGTSTCHGHDQNKKNTEEFCTCRASGQGRKGNWIIPVLEFRVTGVAGLVEVLVGWDLGVVGAVRAGVWRQVGLVRVAVVREGAVRAGVWHQVGLVPAPVRHQVVVVSSDVPHLGFPQEEGAWVVRLQEVVSETSQRSLSLHPLNL